MTSPEQVEASLHNGVFQSHYIPNTPAEQAEMLAILGVNSVDDLFLDIPEAYRNPPLHLPEPLSELEIQQELAALASRNRPLGSGPSFLGAGSYHHFIPSIVKGSGHERRVPHGLHPLSSRGQPGDAAGDFRVPDTGL